MNFSIPIILVSTLTVAYCSNAIGVEPKTAKSSTKSEHYTPLIGFRGIAWGENPADAHGFMLNTTDKYGSYYSREHENLRLGGANLYSITYKTYNQKLYAVFFDFSDEQNYKLIANKFSDEFGDAWASSNDKIKKELSWEFNETTTKDSIPTVRVFLRFNKKTQQGVAAFIHDKLSPPIHLYFTTDSPSNGHNNSAEASKTCESKQEIKLRVFHSMYEDKISADKAYSKIKSNLAEPQFNQLKAAAEKESIDVGSNNSGGDLGYIQIGQFDEGFENSVFNLPLNTLSQPIQSIYGWHLVWVTDAINTKTNMHCQSYLRQ